MGYVVTAPLIQARKGDGSFVHIYEGGNLPDDQDPHQLEQLLAGNMVAEQEGDSDKPAASAAKAKWKAYAVAQGMDEAEADSMTRDELADHFA